jgi:hypothetical protein
MSGKVVRTSWKSADRSGVAGRDPPPDESLVQLLIK